jgi:hypothetical protein
MPGTWPATAAPKSRTARRFSTPSAARPDRCDRAWAPWRGTAGSTNHTEAVELAAAVEAALPPGTRVEGRRTRGLRAVVRGAVSGLVAQHDLLVHDAAFRARPLRVAVPGGEVVAANVAAAVDTALAIRRRFGDAVSHLRVISFDLSNPDLVSGRQAGSAHQTLSIVHLNAAYVQAPAPVSPAFLREVTAHELWHLIDGWLQARRYRDTIELRRALGEHFGAPSLEHVTRGDVPGARDRLVTEVSAYAATNPVEATAELFEQWWTRPSSAHSPAVRLFGELVERYLPAPS